MTKPSSGLYTDMIMAYDDTMHIELYRYRYGTVATKNGPNTCFSSSRFQVLKYSSKQNNVDMHALVTHNPARKINSLTNNKSAVN